MAATRAGPGTQSADVIIDFRGITKRVQPKAGDGELAQALAAQTAFGRTLLCGPIEKTGYAYTILVEKPAVYQVILEKGDERTKMWVDNTKTKTISDEAQRLFGQRCTVEQLSEPGHVYRVKAPLKRTGKVKPDIASRSMTGPGVKPVVPPSLAKSWGPTATPISTRSQEGRDIIATGEDRATGYRGCDLQIIPPQKKQTIKNVAISRHAPKSEIAQLIARQLRVDPLHEDYLELAPDHWFETSH
jgi:hypothetical protein